MADLCLRLLEAEDKQNCFQPWEPNPGPLTCHVRVLPLSYAVLKLKPLFNYKARCSGQRAQRDSRVPEAFILQWFCS